MKVFLSIIFLVCLTKVVFSKSNPSVYVVTPSSKGHSDEGRSAPFYYHNWKRRMDYPINDTSTTTSTVPPTSKTPDLIFAEFESDGGDNMKKSIRNLLQKERVNQKTTTIAPTSTENTYLQPIYVPDEEIMHIKQDVPIKKDETMDSGINDNFYSYNDHLNTDSTHIYLPSTTTTTLPPQLANVENIWHIIDNEKRHQYSNKWTEVPIDSSDDQMSSNEPKIQQNSEDEEKSKTEMDAINENFAFPGFPSNPTNGGENESRAIRTDPNVRFPYVSLKPYQMKNMKNPVPNTFSNSKKSNNMFNNLDSFKEIRSPVRGEVEDVSHIRQPIERYNPAQPYLPHDYGSKSKQSDPSSNFPSNPSKAVANLVPPPPPPPPKATGNDFPAPTNYESFPPYAVPTPDAVPDSPPASPPLSIYPSNAPVEPPSFSSINSDFGDDSMDLSYQYKPPSLHFRPTLPPQNKPFSGYSYNKPPSNNKPTMTMDMPPLMDMSDQEDSPPMTDDKPDFHGYHNNKPSTQDDHTPGNYDPHGSYHNDNDYPELIFNKPHGGDVHVKGENDMKDDAAGMMPPPPPADMKPSMDLGSAMDDHGFPSGFPGDFKFHHDFDDHDFYHHHHHPTTTTTTTTTTTESPRVNRFSYYYLGKKLYYLPLYFSVYFIVYVGALIIKAILRHKIVYPNSWRPNDTTSTFFSKRSVDTWNLSNENLHEAAGRITKAIGEAAEKYINET